VSGLYAFQTPKRYNTTTNNPQSYK